jgi:membrane protease YdiL (CAAX protease family)
LQRLLSRETGALARPAALMRLVPTVGCDAVGALGLAGLVIAYGNIVSLRPDAWREDYGWAFIAGSLTLVMLLVVWLLRSSGLPLRDIGLTWVNAGRSALVGAGFAAVIILPVVIYFAFPTGLGGRIDYQDMEEKTWGGFLLWAGVKEPLGTAFFEEALFRGVLLAKMTLAWGARWALGCSSLTFALWHVVISYRTIQDTSVAEPALLAALALVASLLGVLVGGLFLGLLRQRTGNLAGCVAFHWLTVVAMSGTLFLTSR